MKIDINKKDASIILYALSTLIQNMNEDGGYSAFETGEVHKVNQIIFDAALKSD